VVTSLAMQSKGVQEPPLVCMFMTLQNLQHTICTAFGDSDSTYGGECWVVPLPGLARGNKKKGPPQGAGQGNGAAPTMWAVVSTPMLEIMQEEAFCTVFKALISDEEISLWVMYSWMIQT